MRSTSFFAASIVCLSLASITTGCSAPTEEDEQAASGSESNLTNYDMEGALTGTTWNGVTESDGKHARIAELSFKSDGSWSAKVTKPGACRTPRQGESPIAAGKDGAEKSSADGRSCEVTFNGIMWRIEDSTPQGCPSFYLCGSRYLRLERSRTTSMGSNVGPFALGGLPKVFWSKGKPLNVSQFEPEGNFPLPEELTLDSGRTRTTYLIEDELHVKPSVPARSGR